MWIKLLGSQQPIGAMMRPQLVNGKWHKPVIQGRQKAQLRNYFQKAGVPWIYENEKPEVHAASAYNRRMKGTSFKNNYETRLAMIRKNLSGMDEKLHNLRKDRINNKPPTEDEQIMLSVYKVLQSEQSAGKFKQ